MSEIKVNKISPRTNCGTTQLGDSGDTITIPAGATISNSGTAAGFGSTGEVSWNTTKITADPSTAATGVGYFTDTSGGAFNVTLPASPSAGNVVAVADYANTWDTNNLTIARNGSNIEGSAANFVCNQEGASVTFVYVDATKGWVVVNSGNSSQAFGASYIVASGGNSIVTCGNFKIHKFSSPGTFTVCSVGCSAGSNTVQVLLVAGGGGGGGDRGAGAGGGGVVFSPCAGVPVSATGFPISVGGGGTGGPGPGPGPARNGSAGTNTTGLSLTAIGGGFGAGGGGGVNPDSGGPGGSGGGGGVGDPGSQPHAGGPGTQPAQPGNSGTFGFGNNGGAGNPAGPPNHSSGGGGGGGAVGATGDNSGSGNGGTGKDVTPIFGASPQPFYEPSAGLYAGGGGGGASNNVGAGTGGTATAGGGPGGSNPGSPSSPNGSAGTTNTGGGGGGGANIPGQGAGANGGSGVVLIRYKFQ